MCLVNSLYTLSMYFLIRHENNLSSLLIVPPQKLSPKPHSKSHFRIHFLISLNKVQEVLLYFISYPFELH